MKRILSLLVVLAALPAAAAYDANGVALGMSEAKVKQRFPSAYCKPLEWKSDAAERRCDDGKISFAGIEARITLFLKKDAVQAFDLRFDTKDLDKVAVYLKTAYGPPKYEGRELIRRGDKPPREIYKVRWEGGGDQAVLTSQLEKKRSELNVSRGNFEEEIYRVK